MGYLYTLPSSVGINNRLTAAYAALVRGYMVGICGVYTKHFVDVILVQDEARR